MLIILILITTKTIRVSSIIYKYNIYWLRLHCILKDYFIIKLKYYTRNCIKKHIGLTCKSTHIKTLNKNLFKNDIT